MRTTTSRRSLFGRILTIPAAAAIALTVMAATPVSAAAATGQGTGLRSEVVCDPGSNQIRVRAYAQAAPGLNVQRIMARFSVAKELANGSWTNVLFEGYTTSRWLPFTHYRSYNGIYSQTGMSEWITYTMPGDGTYYLWTQHTFDANGAWTTPGYWYATQSYLLYFTQTKFYSFCYL